MAAAGQMLEGGDRFRIEQMDMRGFNDGGECCKSHRGFEPTRRGARIWRRESRRKLLTAVIAFRIVEPDVDEAAIHEALCKDNGEMDPAMSRSCSRGRRPRGKRAVPRSACHRGRAGTHSTERYSTSRRVPTPSATLVRAARQDASAPLAVAPAEGGQVTWTYIATAHPTMRPFSHSSSADTCCRRRPSSPSVGRRLSARRTRIQLDRIEGDYSRSSTAAPTCVHASAKTASWPH